MPATGISGEIPLAAISRTNTHNPNDCAVSCYTTAVGSSRHLYSILTLKLCCEWTCAGVRQCPIRWVCLAAGFSTDSTCIPVSQ